MWFNCLCCTLNSALIWYKHFTITETLRVFFSNKGNKHQTTLTLPDIACHKKNRIPIIFKKWRINYLAHNFTLYQPPELLYYLHQTAVLNSLITYTYNYFYITHICKPDLHQKKTVYLRKCITKFVLHHIFL